MLRPALCAAGALLFLATLPALSAAPIRRAPAPVPASLPVALQAAYTDFAAGQNSGSYAQWLDGLPGFRFAPATARLLADALGPGPLFTVQRLPADPGVHDYSLAVPARRHTGADGSTLDWTAMQGRLTAPADGATLTSTLSARAMNSDDMAMHVSLRDVTYAAVTRRSAGALPLGGSRVDVGSLQATFKPLAMAVALTGMFTKSITADQGKTVAIVLESGARTIDVAGERIEDMHFAMRVDGIDKATLTALYARSNGLAGQPSAALAPMVQQLGMAFVARGAAVTFDDVSFRYRGSAAHLRGQFHFENAAADDLKRPEDAFKKIVAHLEITLPSAMLHAFADNTARAQLARQGKADLVAVAKAGQGIYDGLLKQALAAGLVRVQGDMLVSTIDVRDGVVLVNGKPIQLPQSRPPLAGAVDSRAALANMTPPLRIGATCTLPAFPADVVAQDKALVMALHMSVNADGSVGQPALALGSGLPGYDRAVLAAAARCRYVPARRDGLPVAATSRWDIVRSPGSPRP